MAELDTNAGFNAWWGLLSEGTKAGLDRRVAWMAFAAGYRYRASPIEKTYRFQAGRWTVAVRAESMKLARSKAIEKLDQRAIKAGAAPPSGGWSLTKIPSSG